MATEASNVKSGLEGVVVGTTALSSVDGLQGRLVIAGRDVEAWAPRATFEEACALLWAAGGLLAASAADLQRMLGRARLEAFGLLAERPRLLEAADPMEALRGAVAALQARDLPLPAQAVLATGAVAVFAAASARHQNGSAALAPDPALGQAEDYLRMLSGETPAPKQVRALETYLCTVADHGMNASTFAARVVASTGSDSISSAVAGLCALKGPLHGGAPGPVLDMLDAIGDPENAERWILGELAAGRRLMGLGHRVYRVRDPRAAVLEGAVRALEHLSPRLELARAVERTATDVLQARYPERGLKANVEFYTAVLLEALGIPRQLFTPTFAVGRVIGWCGHVAEERKAGRLIRPAVQYVGAFPGAGPSDSSPGSRSVAR